MGHQDQRERRQRPARDQKGPALAVARARMIAQMPDDRLDDQSGDRPRDPQQGQFGDVGAERLEDAARIGIMQPPDDLDAEPPKANAPPPKPARRLRPGWPAPTARPPSPLHTSH